MRITFTKAGAGCRAALLKLEEDYIERQCAEIAKHKPDLVITEKGLSDLAMHFLTKAGVSAIRRLRKTDNNRIARATGATIVHRCIHPSTLTPGSLSQSTFRSRVWRNEVQQRDYLCLRHRRDHRPPAYSSFQPADS